MGVKAWATTNNVVWAAPSGAIITSLVDNDNPLAIRPFTMRFQFSDGSYDPTSESWISGSLWVQVASSPNTWDFTYANSAWTPVGHDSIFKNRFQDRSNLVTVLGGNLVGVTRLVNLFYGCTAIYAVNIFDTSTVTDLSGLFHGCTLIPSIPALNTSSATNMASMFAHCASITTIPQLDTSSVTDMSSMFYDCASLTSVPLLDTSNVTTMNTMFRECTSLTTIPQFDTSSVTDMSDMFMLCSNLTTVPLLNTSEVTQMGYMFDQCNSLTALPLFDTRHVIHAGYMCHDCYGLTAVPLLRTDNLDECFNMFEGCRNVETGAFALYQQMSTQPVVPYNHSYCFTQCGLNTPSGQAELAQIPTSWGGTMA